jgi:predicted nucleic acid-binding protein
LTEYLLDTNVVIEWLRGRRNSIELIRSLTEAGALLGVNAITTAEIYSGLEEGDVSRAEEVFGAFDFWVIEFDVARLAGQLRQQYRRRGVTLPATDALIAAHAISRDATLVTDNTRDFPMPELRILTVN